MSDSASHVFFNRFWVVVFFFFFKLLLASMAAWDQYTKEMESYLVLILRKGTVASHIVSRRVIS